MRGYCFVTVEGILKTLIVLTENLLENSWCKVDMSYIEVNRLLVSVIHRQSDKFSEMRTKTEMTLFERGVSKTYIGSFFHL